MTHMSRRSALVLAGTLGSLLAAAPPAAAQQQAPPAAGEQQTAPPAAQQPAPLPPGSPLIGRPDTAAAQKLAPIAPPPIPVAADKLPLDKLKAPKGFTIDVYASGVDNARTLRLGDKGTVFVSSRLKDKIYAIVDKGGKREVKVVASGLYRPNGIVLHKGTLYIAELSQISKIENRRSPALHPAEADRHLQRSAQRRGARLEISHDRARREALFPGWRAVQHLHAVRPPRQDLPSPFGGQRPGSRREGPPPDRRDGLAPDL